MARRHHGPLVLGKRRLQLRWSHVGPEHAAALDQRVALQLHALAELRVAQLGWDLDALAGHVVLPAVIRTAQPVLLVAPEPERYAAVRAELVDESQPVLRVAERDQALAEDLHPHRRAVGLRQLFGEERRQPVAAEKLAHRRVWTGSAQQFVLFRSHERGSCIVDRPILPQRPSALRCAVPLWRMRFGVTGRRILATATCESHATIHVLAAAAKNTRSVVAR